MNHSLRLNDTIAAIASPPGSAARSIVRISGPATREIIDQLAPDLPAERGFWECSLRIPEIHSPLPVQIGWMPAPQTYTGDDCAEIHLIGSPPIVEQLLSTIYATGARPAQPGEFTMRAFLAGKKDLAQSEAVQAVVQSRSTEALNHSLAMLAGNVSQPLHALRDDLMNLLADLEAGLDFSDEDISFVDQRDALLRISAGMAHLMNLQKKLKNRTLLQNRYKVVLAGPPNVGKSTLFNALLNQDAALTSPIAGTTRDYLVAEWRLDQLVVELVDTAGWHATTDELDARSQHLGRQQLFSAHLVLVLTDSHQHELPADAFPHHVEVLTVHTKADLRAELPTGIAVSAVAHPGIEHLKQEIDTRARNFLQHDEGTQFSRCQGHVDTALNHLRAAHQRTLFEDPPELTALELREAIAQIGEMIGAVYTNDLLDKIFTRFCIGK
ncbi:MAG: tRNA modification GTPase [Zavarzinella sp.]